ncbi:MAG: catalase [Christensenellales bacterium]|jgi:catalase
MSFNQEMPPASGSAKEDQLKEFISHDDGKQLTTDFGLKLPNTDQSLTAGMRGPTLLEDFHLREKITHFDHERIPERVVHARGFGVHGVFQPYESMSEYTQAAFLSDPSVVTPVFTRFSTVVGSKGSADTVRDVRGFATKFYTSEGNFDIVGNNMPVFFIQDAIKFPDIVHSIKPEPDNDIPQATAAHDTFWDFVVNSPETAHMIMWLMSDRGIPRSFRMMDGFGVNTFRLINEKGVARFVKFHWRSLLGAHALDRDEAQRLCGKDPDFHRRDIWDAIEMGEYPEYELCLQILEEKDEFSLGFDILDPTKLWPEEVVPLKAIGKMTLNRNVDNFFAETEQVAFCPANIVPGIDFSNDPLLQGRLFSYHDTQLLRLGGPNFHEIPINRPVVPVHNNQRDGFHRMTINSGKVSYLPNSLNSGAPVPVPEAEGGYAHYAQRVSGSVIRARSDSFTDFYSQAAMFWNSMSPAEKEHIIDAFHFEVGGSKDKTIRQRTVDMFNNVSNELAVEMAKRLGATAPKPIDVPSSSLASPALSQENTYKTARGRKVAILAANGFDYNEVSLLMDKLKAEGVCCEIVSEFMGMLTGTGGNQLEAAKDYATITSLSYDAVYVAGGSDSAAALAACPATGEFIKEAFKHYKTIAASNEGVGVVRSANINVLPPATGTQGAQFPMPGIAFMEGEAATSAFFDDFIKLIAMHRHWLRAK